MFGFIDIHMKCNVLVYSERQFTITIQFQFQIDNILYVASVYLIITITHWVI